MHRVTRAARAGLFVCLILVAAGSLDAALRLATLPGLWDARDDSFAFVCLAIRFHAAAGAAAGLALVAIGALLPSRERDPRGPRRPFPSKLAAALMLPPLALLALTGARLLARPSPPPGAPSLVLITVDTLRADAIDRFRRGGALPDGLERASTPSLDALAARGCVFIDASTPIPKTPQAFSTLMTGTYPSRHGLRNLFETLGPDNVTVAEILRARGWLTRAVITNGLVDRPSGISQGFDVYRPRDGLRSEVKSLRIVALPARVAPGLVRRALNRFPSLRITTESAGDVTDRALAALKDVDGRPHFLWIHYLDPHWPYLPPEPWRGRADTEPATPLTIYDDLRSGKVRIGEMIHHNGMTPAEVKRLVSLYAGEVSYMDGEIGRLLDAIHASSDAASTVVIFTSDHGESLGEHRYFFSHGDLVYQSSMHVPLIIEIPGETPGEIPGEMPSETSGTRRGGRVD
jgi:arylsulfatase A-like enzyme